MLIVSQNKEKVLWFGRAFNALRPGIFRTGKPQGKEGNRQTHNLHI